MTSLAGRQARIGEARADLDQAVPPAHGAVEEKSPLAGREPKPAWEVVVTPFGQGAERNYTPISEQLPPLCALWGGSPDQSVRPENKINVSPALPQTESERPPEAGGRRLGVAPLEHPGGLLWASGYSLFLSCGGLLTSCYSGPSAALGLFSSSFITATLRALGSVPL